MSGRLGGSSRNEACYSFDGSWSMFYNGCQLTGGHKQSVRKYRLTKRQQVIHRPSLTHTHSLSHMTLAAFLRRPFYSFCRSPCSPLFPASRSLLLNDLLTRSLLLPLRSPASAPLLTAAAAAAAGVPAQEGLATAVACLFKVSAPEAYHNQVRKGDGGCPMTVSCCSSQLHPILCKSLS